MKKFITALLLSVFMLPTSAAFSKTGVKAPLSKLCAAGFVMYADLPKPGTPLYNATRYNAAVNAYNELVIVCKKPDVLANRQRAIELSTIIVENVYAKFEYKP